MATKRVEALIARIMKECEREGMTVGEVAEIPETLNERLSEALRLPKFKAPGNNEEDPL